jgi:rhodanese-related sulfurtransferase
MTTITAAELKARMDNKETLNLIDVREPHEYAEANIGAKLIPLGQIMGMQIDDLEDLREQEIIIHCRSGMRSMQACMMLEQMGFTNTVNVQGGILAYLELEK